MDKGKGKGKEVKEVKSKLEFGFPELVEDPRGLRQDLRELWTDFLNTHRVTMQIANQTADVANSVEDMTRHFVPYLEEREEETGISRNAGEAEDDGEETLQ